MSWVHPQIGRIVARDVGQHAVMDEVAARILAKAKGLAAQHVDTGNYAAALSVERIPGKHGVTDRAVIAGDPAALSIEYGHTTPKGTRVPGQHILRRAAQ